MSERIPLEEALRIEIAPPLSSTGPLAADSALAGCQIRAWTPDPQTLISFDGEGSSAGTEEFRALRSQLYGLRSTKPVKSVLVTSAMPREGKSFVAANLANVLALQPQCRVVLIDGNLRSPQLHSVLGTSSTPGLSEYLLQELDELGIMQRGAAEGLFFIPAGRSVFGPTELLAGNRLKSLIERCNPVFDWIVIDSPATLPVSDACLLANFCDGVLMVVRSHSTPFDVVCKARDKFREDSIVGVVLNRIAEASPPDRH
jgi:capsular exopolysaccharide synthesis family protein